MPPSAGLDRVPPWAWKLLASPGGKMSVRADGDVIVDVGGRAVGRIDHGIIRFNIEGEDASTDYYRSIGGAHFYDRSAVPYAMSKLDTPVYHQLLKDFAPPRKDAVVVDIGGGDGRNALPWLQWGFTRVVVIDLVAAALMRFRKRIAAEKPALLKNLLLVEGDARALPLAERVADRVLAIESLCYLNEDYERGLAECCRVLRPTARLVLSDRDYETALLLRLLYYGGLTAMVQMANSRDLWDGVEGKRVRSRCFTRDELITVVEKEKLRVLDVRGISAFSLVLSYLSKTGQLGSEEHASQNQIRRLLLELGRNGTFVRCHVVIAARNVRKPKRQQRCS